MGTAVSQALHGSVIVYIYSIKQDRAKQNEISMELIKYFVIDVQFK